MGLRDGSGKQKVLRKFRLLEWTHVQRYEGKK